MHGLSLVAVGGAPLHLVPQLLTVAASLLKHRLEHRLEVGGFQHSGLSSRGTKSELLHDM